MTEPLPERVGPYRIDRILGAGGMGTVYHGVHDETGEPAAVKVLPSSMARETGFVARFTREVDAMRTLEGPHIVKLYESGVDGDIYYYAMEYVDGETLTDRLRREKRIPWREAVEMAVQICKALKSAHNAGVIHRDLKPSNLLIAQDGTVKLTDFGVAQVFAGGKLTMTGGVIGTAEYMSPEQAQGQRATKRSDIYSLGAVLYVMLTGRPPFTGQTALEIAQKHRYNQFDSARRIVTDIPRWLDEIICQCLEKRPEDRFPDAYVLSLRLAEVPRKVDYVKGSETFEFGDAQGTDDTLSATSGEPAASADIGGTLMRDLMRAHVEQTHAQSPIQSLLDNTWILLGLLGLLILGGVVWYRSKDESPAERFAKGEALMQRARSGAWEEAGSKYFEPLLALDAEEWGPKVQPYLDQIAAYQVERDLMGPDFRRTAVGDRTEAERFLMRALDERDRGNLAASEKSLLALSVLLGNDAESQRWQRITQELLRQVRAEQAHPEGEDDRYVLLRDSLQRAAQAESQGHLDEARRIWRSAVTLYDDDPGAESLLAEARRKLTETAPAPAPSSHE